MTDLIDLNRKPTPEELSLVHHLSAVSVVAYAAGVTFAESINLAFGMARAEGKITSKLQERWLKRFFIQAWATAGYAAQALSVGSNMFLSTSAGVGVSTAQVYRRMKGIERELAEHGWPKM